MTTANHMPLIPQQCEVCESRSDLLRCSGCQVVHYCGNDRERASPILLSHICARWLIRSADQRLDWGDHKSACVATKKARTRFSEEEAALRSKPIIGFGRVFDEHVGHFWGIGDTRDYMRRRYDFVDTVLEHFPSHQIGVQTAVDHIMDMLRLNRSDNMGLREQVPALMLRLGRDQDAYDFVKWWATCDPDGDRDYHDLELPHLDTRDADALEEPEWLTGRRFLDLSHASVVVLIKFRLLFTLRDLQNTPRALQGTTLPREIVDQVRGELLADSILAGRWDLASANTAVLAGMIERVKKQIWALYFAVKDTNADFWSILMAAADGTIELERPDSYSLGSQEEAELMVLFNYPAWEETPGALDEINVIWSSQIL